MTKNLDSTGMFHFISDQILTENSPEIACEQTGKGKK